ncbi:MAG: hypothetical protein CMD81_15150 [Gammaproteobacteria bacterium]|nr:hypothetical protein [Gammaproteobacteria bacterium]HBF07798.1 hypothetical protein [Gammaproteobacteria bacterium]|tara:strand:- start:2750 stop:3304 length:555 start_codon:yes stop_codon:yes gene_type:complete
MATYVFWLLLVGCIGTALLLGLLKMERWRNSSINKASYRPKSRIYDAIERLFLGHLVWAVGRHVIIMGKVRLADVITLGPDLKGKMRKEAYDRIARQHIDFVLCDKKTTQILCAVELYDPTANPKQTLMQARFIDDVFKQAGIPIARFPRAKKYLSHEIESAVRKTLAAAGVSWAQDRKARAAS